MPELPEVETIRRTLLDLEGHKIVDYHLYTASVLKKADYPLDDIRGKAIEEIRRRGKFLVLDLGKARLLVVHLGMSGRFYRMSPGEPAEKHLHFKLIMDNGEEIRYVDARRFGGIRLVSDEVAFFSQMGPEPWSSEASSYLISCLARRRGPVKSALLDQCVIAGIGNIYADEILFAAGIDPRRSCQELSWEEVERLARLIPQVMEAGIAQRGTTFRDYRDGEGNPGGFADYLQVYGKKGESCPRCGTPLECIRIAGRSTHFCPHCQK